MKLPDRAALLAALRVRRNQVLLALFVLVLAARIAAPYVLRPIIVEQADKAMVGHIELGDLDLSLIRGGVTLHDFAVYAEERPAPGSTEEQKPPLFATKYLWTQISWLALLWKTIDVEEFELDEFIVRLNRLKDGLVLPKPAPSAEPEPAETTDEPSSWAFAADSLGLRKGAVVFQDFTVGDSPQRFDLAIPNLAARKLALRFDPSGPEPGHVEVEALIGDGKIGFAADLDQKEAGPSTHSNIVLANLPIGGVRVYLKMFGWSDLSGTLDASIDHRFETKGAHEISGVMSLSNVAIKVPKLKDRPALTFDKLTVALDKVDVVKQHAAVADVTLAGAHVVVDPKARDPLPVLEKPAPNKDQIPEELAAETPPAEPQRPWTWTLKRARLQGAEVELLGADDPLSLGVDAQVQTVASPTTGVSPVSLVVRHGSGELDVKGDLTLEPTSFKGKLALKDFALAPLAARAPLEGADILKKGNARADLEVILAGRGASAPGVSDLRVSGTIGLAGLSVAAPGFGVAWKDFAVAINEVTVQPALGGDPAKPRAVAVALKNVELTEPDIAATRTADGIVLPKLGPAKPATDSPEPPPAEPAGPSAAAPDVKVKIARMKVNKGKARLTDKSVTPFYEGRVESFEYLGNLTWPGLKNDPFLLTMNGLHGAVLTVTGGINPPPGRTRVRAKLETLPLAPFNPYVTASGFALSQGSLALQTTAHMENDKYDSSSNVAIDQLELGGAEGEALFEKNFGIPLSMALGLLKDPKGVITLTVPVDGDRAGARVGLASLAGQALRKALVGALASPLKLLGVTTKDGKVQGMTPEPVEFLAGAALPSEAGQARIDQIGVLLASAPGISLTLHGGTSLGDEHALRERVLLEELERTSGLRALGQLGAIGVRRAARQYLEARAAGEAPPDLDVEQKAWLEAQLPQQKLPPNALESLAEQRATVLRAKLVDEKGVAAERVTIAAPAPAGSLSMPGVSIDVGATSD